MSIVISESSGEAKAFIDRINLVQGSIVEQGVDVLAMVMPRNLDFCGGINEAIARGAGYDVDGFILDNIYRPDIAKVYALPGGELAAENILLGIIPYYRSDIDIQERDLLNAVRSIMEIAGSLSFRSIAFPPLASGRKLFPKRKAARLIIKGIIERMHEGMEEVRLVCLDQDSYAIFEERLSSI